MKTEKEILDELNYLKEKFKNGAFTEHIDNEKYGVDIVCMVRALKWVLECQHH